MSLLCEHRDAVLVDGRAICAHCGTLWRDAMAEILAPPVLQAKPDWDGRVRKDASLIIAQMDDMRRKPRGVDRRVLVSPETIARNDRMWAEHDREDAEKRLRRRSIFTRMRDWLWGAR